MVAVLATAGACTRPNPAVCCLDQADCDEVGIGDVRGCAEGLACVDHQCEVPSCAEAGCSASAPVCNTTTDGCDPCTDSSECTRFDMTPLCEPTSGSCVQCLTADDCPSTAPICDAYACRAPATDDDCPSGALDADLRCVPESDVVYLDPNGTDVGSCNRAVPCKTLTYGVSQTALTRSHIVFAYGLYTYADGSYSGSSTSAPSLFLHGHGAKLQDPTSGENCFLGFSLPVWIRDMTLTADAIGTAICLFAGQSTLERVETSAGYGVQTAVGATIRQFRQVGGIEAILFSGSLVLDGAVIDGCRTGIENGSSASLQVSNALIFGTTARAFALDDAASGTITSTTIATDGSTGTGSRAITCPSTVLLRSSIVWSINSGAQQPIAGCSVMDVIAGPTVVAGTMNVDPMFVDATHGDYHLGTESPARDAVDTGPPVDFDGDARPQGARYDIGADEATP